MKNKLLAFLLSGVTTFIVLVVTVYLANSGLEPYFEALFWLAIPVSIVCSIWFWIYIALTENKNKTNEK
jgi:hypothetical protein